MKGSIEIYDKTEEAPIGHKNKKKVLNDEQFMEPVWKSSTDTNDTVVAAIIPPSEQRPPLQVSNLKVDFRYQRTEPPRQSNTPVINVSDPLEVFEPNTARSNVPILDVEAGNKQNQPLNSLPALSTLMSPSKMNELRLMIHERVRSTKPSFVSNYSQLR